MADPANGGADEDIPARSSGLDFSFGSGGPSDEEEDGGGSGSGSAGSIPSPRSPGLVAAAADDDDDADDHDHDHDHDAAAAAAPATPDAERQLLLLMLLAQVCSLHDPTPRTFAVHVLSLFERGLLDRASVRFLFDLGLVPGDYRRHDRRCRQRQHQLLECGGGEEWQHREEPGRLTQERVRVMVPYEPEHESESEHGSEHKAQATCGPAAAAATSDCRSRGRSRGNSANLNTGDSAILGVIVDADDDDDDDDDDDVGKDDDDNPLRDIFGNGAEKEAARAHRRTTLENKARALQRAERRRREVEVQSIREHLERHDSVLSGEEAPMDAAAIAIARAGAAAVAGAATEASVAGAGGTTSSAEDDDARAGQRQQPQPPAPAGASWSVASHPLSLSRYARDFISIGLLASGAFGDVYRARSKFDQSEYAIKRVCFTAAGYDNSTVQTVVREVRCLAQLDHPNCVRYYSSWLEPSWMTGGGKEVDLDTFATEERERLLEGVKRLVLLEDGNADTGESPVTENDTIGTLERDLREMAVSSQSPNHVKIDNRNLSQSSQYGEDVDIGFSFESQSSDEGGQRQRDWDQFQHNAYASQSTGQRGDDSAYSEWSDYGVAGGGRGRGNAIRDFSVSGRKTDDAVSMPSIEGGERSGDAKDKRQHFHQTHHQQRPKQYHRVFPGRQYKYRICLFVQMQLCRPTTLADWMQARNKSVQSGISAHSSLRDQPWVEPALRIYLQITQGLAHVHSKDIIHRDIKPQNIFAALDTDVNGGVPCFRIGDFGLSKMLLDANGGQAFESEGRYSKKHGSDRDEFAANAGHNNVLAVQQEAHTVGIGTASYASPEQVTSSTYGPESDIFSMGLILLELFSTIDSLHERATVFGNCRRGILPDRLCEDFPEVASLVAECTQEIPTRRPSAKAMQEAIESVCLQYDASRGGPVAAQKRADSYLTEIQKLGKQLKERDDELAKMKRLLAEKDDMIAAYQRQAEKKSSLSYDNMSSRVPSQVNGNRSGTSDKVDALGVVQSTSMSSDEDY